VKQLLALLALVACLVIPQLAQALNCPNKPSNAATLATIHFNTSDGEGQLWEIYPGAGQIQSIWSRGHGERVDLPCRAVSRRAANHLAQTRHGGSAAVE